MSVGGGIHGALCRRRGLRARLKRTTSSGGHARAAALPVGLTVTVDGSGVPGGVEWTPVFARPPPHRRYQASGGREQPEQSVPSGGGNGRTITIYVYSTCTAWRLCRLGNGSVAGCRARGGGWLSGREVAAVARRRPVAAGTAAHAEGNRTRPRTRTKFRRPRRSSWTCNDYYGDDDDDGDGDSDSARSQWRYGDPFWCTHGPRSAHSLRLVEIIIIVIIKHSAPRAPLHGRSLKLYIIIIFVTHSSTRAPLHHTFSREHVVRVLVIIAVLLVCLFVCLVCFFFFLKNTFFCFNFYLKSFISLHEFIFHPRTFFARSVHPNN